MKKMFLTGLALLIFIAACTPYMYGVPLESWDRMSEPERIEAMRVYQREQQARRLAAEERARRQAVEEQARRQAAEERARHEALERERAQARQAALEHERRQRLEAIHRGEGAYGELILVRLQGGKAKLGDRYHRYEPLTFTIADGETREINVTDRQGMRAHFVATYAGGALSLESSRFAYDRRWGQGTLYAATDAFGALELRNVDVFIKVHNRSTRIERESPRLVIIRDEEPAVMIRKTETANPPPVVKHGHEAPQPSPVRQPLPSVAERPPRILEVTILSGEMMVRGQKRKLERIALRIAEGESKEITVKAGDENRTVSFSYSNAELFIGGTPGRGRGAVRLVNDKEWKTGKVYRIDLKGKTPLERLEVKVTGIVK